MSRGFLVLPAQEQDPIFTHNFSPAFAEILNAAVESNFGHFESVIFRKHVLRNTPIRRRPAGARKDVGYTRQGLALIRDKVLSTLSGAIFDDDYTGCRFRFRGSFVSPLRRLKEALAKSNGKALSFAQWQRVLWETLAMKPKELGRSEETLLLLLGYKVFRPAGRRHEPIVLPKSRSASSDTAALSRMKLLLKTSPNGLSEKQLLQKVRLAGHHVKLNPSELFRMLKGMLNVEQTGPRGNLLRVRTEGLARVSDRIERVFRERGKPMNAPQLLGELNRWRGKRRLTQKPINLRKTMAADPRFKPIGKSGFWALREWDHIDGRTITDIAADLFRTSKKAMTEAELHRLIAAKRPVRFKSLSTMLRDNSRFRRLGARTWELKRMPRGEQ